MKRIIVLLVTACFIVCVAQGAETKLPKTIYLTFDDGPSPNTPQILDILSDYKIKATFFLLEENIRKYPDFVKRINAEGHAIGLHGKSHDVNIIYSTPSEPLSEMNITNDTLYNVLGFRTKLVRTPYGSYPYMTTSQYEILQSANYKVWDWTVDPRDSVGTPPLSSILQHIKADLKCNSNPIILLHDRKSTASKLCDILDYLKSQSYEFELLTESLEPVNFMELYGKKRKSA